MPHHPDPQAQNVSTRQPNALRLLRRVMAQWENSCYAKQTAKLHNVKGGSRQGFNTSGSRSTYKCPYAGMTFAKLASTRDLLRNPPVTSPRFSLCMTRSGSRNVHPAHRQVALQRTSFMLAVRPNDIIGLHSFAFGHKAIPSSAHTQQKATE